MQIEMDFEPAKHHHRNDPLTSQIAARRAKGFALTHAQIVYTELSKGPATAKEIAAGLGWEYVKVAKRLTDLGKTGYVQRTGAIRENACEWAICPPGQG